MALFNQLFTVSTSQPQPRYKFPSPRLVVDNGERDASVRGVREDGFKLFQCYLFKSEYNILEGNWKPYAHIRDTLVL